MAADRPSRLAALLLLGALAGCHPGRDPGALLGTWQDGRMRVEFAAGGRLRMHSALGVREGSYRRVSPAGIRVDLGSRWPSGEPRYWWAMVSGDQLGLCEIPNGRHCLRLARPGRTLTIPPR